MNKTPRLSKSGIEYMDYSWGIWSGCNNIDKGICRVKACWAKRITTRFTNIYPNGFAPTFYPEAINSPKHLKKPSRIGVGWVGDVIGYCDRVSLRSMIYQTITQCPQHTFLFLTKNPERLVSWSPFPPNCWVGVSATNHFELVDAVRCLKKITATVKYISFEPLLGHINPTADIGLDFPETNMLKSAGIKQVILGSQTKPTVYPQIEWVAEIIEACDKADIPVFLKNNLEGIIPEQVPLFRKAPHILRQEFPNV